jgi:hypothetical protein
MFGKPFHAPVTSLSHRGSVRVTVRATAQAVARPRPRSSRTGRKGRSPGRDVRAGPPMARSGREVRSPGAQLAFPLRFAALGGRWPAVPPGTESTCGGPSRPCAGRGGTPAAGPTPGTGSLPGRDGRVPRHGCPDLSRTPVRDRRCRRPDVRTGLRQDADGVRGPRERREGWSLSYGSREPVRQGPPLGVNRSPRLGANRSPRLAVDRSPPTAVSSSAPCPGAP